MRLLALRELLDDFREPPRLRPLDLREPPDLRLLPDLRPDDPDFRLLPPDLRPLDRLREAPDLRPPLDRFFELPPDRDPPRDDRLLVAIAMSPAEEVGSTLVRNLRAPTFAQHVRKIRAQVQSSSRQVSAVSDARTICRKRQARARRSLVPDS